MLDVLRTFGQEMGLTTSSDHLEDTQLRVVDQLQNRTASIELFDGGFRDGALEFEIAISSSVGHKLPTGFPSRRVWLHVTVYDTGGSVVFESGAWTGNGQVNGQPPNE